MADRPILFSGPMVRALIEGRKTQTRRVLKPQFPDWVNRAGYTCFTPPGHISGRGTYVDEDGEDHGPAEKFVRLPYAGLDRLWVRETHALVGSVDPGWLLYRASGYQAECRRHGFDSPYPPEREVKWRPSIFMPRWASRLTLLVTGVRVQRLQAITGEDALAEGIGAVPEVFHDEGPCPVSDPDCLVREGEYHDACELVDPIAAFSRLWDHLNAGRGFGWDANPWVVAITFTIHRQNIDRLQ